MDEGVSEIRKFWTKAAAAVARLYGCSTYQGEQTHGVFCIRTVCWFDEVWVGWGGRGWGKGDKKKPDEVDWLLTKNIVDLQ